MASCDLLWACQCVVLARRVVLTGVWRLLTLPHPARGARSLRLAARISPGSRRAASLGRQSRRRAQRVSQSMGAAVSLVVLKWGHG